MRKIHLLSVALFLVGGAWVAAWPAANMLHGRVVNGEDAPVPTALVLIQSADGTSPHAFRADAHGRFSRAVSAKGLYDVRAEAGGMWSEWQHNVSVRSSIRSAIILKLVRTAPPAPPK